MKKRSIKTTLFNIAFLVGVMALTFYFVFKDQDLSNIGEYFLQANIWWVLLGVILVFVFVCSESVIIDYLMTKLKYTTRLITCIKYSFVGFFYSCITPSASGGQPMQLYYMVKDGLPASVDMLVLMVIVIAYKAVLVITSGVMFIIDGDFINQSLGNVVYIVIYGIITNVVFIGAILFLIIKPDVSRKLVIKFIGFLAKIHIIKNKEGAIAKAEESMDNYKEGAEFIKKHPMIFFNVYVITFIQRMALFAVTFCVYKAFGLSGTSLIRILTLQTIISLGVDMLPLPGGVGASESSFLVMFGSIFGEKLLLPGMMLSRGISYYFLVIVSGVISVGAHIVSVRKERKKE